MVIADLSSLPSAAPPIHGPQLASFSYFHFNPDIHGHEKPYEMVINSPEIEDKSSSFRRTNEESENCETTTEDVRGKEDGFTLDRNGACRRKWEGLSDFAGIDSDGLKKKGHDWIRAVYVMDAEDFIRAEIERPYGKPVDILKVFDYKKDSVKPILYL